MNERRAAVNTSTAPRVGSDGGIFARAIPSVTSVNHTARHAWLLPALLILFFCSGVSALVYQVTALATPYALAWLQQGYVRDVQRRVRN